MLREVLTTGAIRLRMRAGAASFAFTRIRPGTLWVVATGWDDGGFGAATVAELSAELARFPPDLELFIDATRVVHVSNAARAVWTQWLEDQRHRLRNVHVLTTSRYLHLAVSMSGHDARARIRIHADPSTFAAAVRRAAPAWTGDAEEVLAAEAVPIARRVDGPGAVTLDDGACSYRFRRVARDALVLTLEGADRGVLASDAFDEIARVREAAGRLHLFVDLRAAQVPAVMVSELWTLWFAANRAHLASVVVLAPSSPLYVTASIAHVRSHTGALVRVLEDAAQFDAAIRRVAPAGARWLR